MAIPQGRLSTTPVPGKILPPDNTKFKSLVSHEKGPIAIEDTTQGLIYQNWTLTWNSGTGQLTATPEITAIPEDVLVVADLKYVTFTFDNNGRISIAYSTSVSSFLYWYDTALGSTTTTDLGADVLSPSILLDDKRNTQNAANDMLLWYLKSEGGGTYELFMLIQRERFMNEYSMITGLEYKYMYNAGMSDELRIQLSFSNIPPRSV